LKTRGLTIPEIVLIGGTRVAIGAGIGFLLSGRLNKDQQNAAGWALFAVGDSQFDPDCPAGAWKAACSRVPVELAALIGRMIAHKPSVTSGKPSIAVKWLARNCRPWAKAARPHPRFNITA
jgi:hypothetical protein